MIAIVGSGRVAQAMGRLLASRGERVGWVAARNAERGEAAARFIGGGARAILLGDLASRASRVLIAVSDEAVTPVAGALAAGGLTSGVALHTCGAFGADALDPLAAAGVSCGSLHPLQTVPTAERGVQSIPGSVFGVTAEGGALEWALSITERLAGRPVLIAPEARPFYHAAAVMAGNFPAALLAASASLLARTGLDTPAAVAALAPLAEAAVRNVATLGLVEAMTGPLVRGDADTIARHLAALRHTGPEADLYLAACRCLLPLAAAQGTPVLALDAIERLLAEEERRHA